MTYGDERIIIRQFSSQNNECVNGRDCIYHNSFKPIILLTDVQYNQCNTCKSKNQIQILRIVCNRCLPWKYENDAINFNFSIATQRINEDNRQ